jgi:hypothetical protein
MRLLPRRLVNLYWTSFLPEDWNASQPSGSGGHLSLLTSLYLEVTPQAQQATLLVISTMLQGSAGQPGAFAFGGRCGP